MTKRPGRKDNDCIQIGVFPAAGQLKAEVFHGRRPIMKYTIVQKQNNESLNNKHCIQVIANVHDCKYKTRVELPPGN